MSTSATDFKYRTNQRFGHTVSKLFPKKMNLWTLQLNYDLDFLPVQETSPKCVHKPRTRHCHTSVSQPKQSTWMNELVSSVAAHVNCLNALICILTTADSFYMRAGSCMHVETIKTINFSETVISGEERLPGLNWQSTRSVIVVCCCLLTSVTALRECHRHNRSPHFSVCTSVDTCCRIERWQLCDGHVSAEFLS